MSDLAMKVRPARRTELGEIFTLVRAAMVGESLEHRPADLPPLGQSIERATISFEDPDVTVLVASATQEGDWGRRGRVLGFLRLRAHGDSLDLGRIVVAPDLRGQGIGSALLEAAIDQGTRHPAVTHLTLLAGTVPVQVLAIYRRHGFTDAPSDRDERGVRTVVMARPV